MDLEIREFTQAIVDYINKSKLPVEVKRLSLRDICAKLETVADNVIREQIAEREKEKKEQETAKEASERDEQGTQ